ncbi:hypothetical protein LCL96_07350 [Rossellomorea aquimaris]|nr:hypothetical protein [Rossellomorea aquimaris]MCA1058744.1 hypothetical protein [Rossellomorea aquimaris]
MDKVKEYFGLKVNLWTFTAYLMAQKNERNAYVKARSRSVAIAIIGTL